MRQGIVYRGNDGLELMESLCDNTYKLIYIDPPYNIQNNIDFAYHEGNAYGQYITQLLENAVRLLVDDGILCFLAPSTRYTDINFQFMLDQMFGNSMSVTIERAIRPTCSQNNDTLYFYSKDKNYKFNRLRELAAIDRFPHRDSFDYYRLRLGDAAIERGKSFEYEWKGIKPKKAWRYTKEKMQELHAQNRIEIKKEHVYIKEYRSEHPVTVSSVWKNEGFPAYAISEENMRRMFSLFVKSGDEVLAPFDRDGVFPYVADCCGLNWSVWHLSNLNGRADRLNDIDASHYIEKNIDSNKQIQYKKKIITNATEANEIQECLEQLSYSITELQNSLDIDSSEEIVEAVIEKMHQKIMDETNGYSFDSCYCEAKECFGPCWDKLEDKSRLFIPTGIFLYRHFQGNKKADIASVLLEYCKALECELLNKVFKGYGEKIKSGRIIDEIELKKASNKNDTRFFAQFLLKHVKNDTSERNFELGKMIHVLLKAFESDKDKPILIRNFKDHLIDLEFGGEKFVERLNEIRDIRNACAHGSLMNVNLSDARDLIQEKILILLRN